MKQFFSTLRLKKGSVLIEGLIVLTVINIMVILIFSYLRSINESHTSKIHKERATFLMIETFEKLMSARDSAINKNIKLGWKNFVKEISVADTETNKTHFYQISSQSDSDYLEGALHIIPEGVNPVVFEADVAPFANYYTTIQAVFPKEPLNKNESDMVQNLNKVIFDVKVSWQEPTEVNEVSSDLYNVQQSLILTNHRIYENLY